MNADQLRLKWQALSKKYIAATDEVELDRLWQEMLAIEVKVKQALGLDFDELYKYLQLMDTSPITKEQIFVGATFKLYGDTWTVDAITTHGKLTMVETSRVGGRKGDYRTELYDLLDLLNNG